MIPHSARFIVILSLIVSSNLHAAFLTGDEGQAWKPTSPVKDHKDNHAADSLLLSRRTLKANMETTILPITTPAKTQNSWSVVHGDTSEASLTSFLAYPVSQVQNKVFKAPSSTDRRRPEMRLSDTWVLREFKAAAQRLDDTGLKQKQIDLLTTLQDDRRMVEEFTTRPPRHTNSLTGKPLKFNRSVFSKSIHNLGKDTIQAW